MENIVIYVVLGLLLIIGFSAMLLLLGYPAVFRSEACGMEDCHGLDIRCGSNVPQACTEVYMAGDRCRQYAECGMVEGRCSVIAGKEFDRCKACVEKCLEKEDPMDVFSCEDMC